VTRRRKIALGAAGALLLAWLLVPRPPLREGLGFSRAVFDRDGRLLRLTAAPDQRFRLWVPLARISPRLVEATLLHEDRWFWVHPGVNPVSLARGGLRTYLGGGRRVGGSTLTMQLARIRYGLDTRSVGGKLLQVLKALQLERHYAKQELLEAYLNLAPYGRNVEGAGAASLVYFDKEAGRLSLVEALALAVVPQNPGRRVPGDPAGDQERARAALARRWRAVHPGEPAADAGLAAGPEARPAPMAARAPEALPFLAPHFVDGVLASGAEGAVVTTLDLRLQRLLERTVHAEVARGRPVGIDNAAALLLDWRSMEVLAAVGSAGFFDARIDGQVDGTRARRSPGSALKPFVYGLALDQGLIHPRTILKDSPTRFRGYDPENFDGQFFGPIAAGEALVRSRNVPAVELATRLSPGLHGLLARAGVGGLRPEPHYGLSLVLGGAEVTMEELAALYAALASGGTWRPPRTRLAAPPAGAERLLSAEAAWTVLDMLEQNPRPGPGLERARRDAPIAWKTGTSHGYRDAWAVGVSGRFVLAVWIGRFDGQGNPAFVGVEAAAPLFFRVTDALRASGLAEPVGRPQPAGVSRVAVCPVSGKLPGPSCRQAVDTWFLPGVSPIDTCDVHRAVLVDGRTGRRACRAGPGTRLEVFELWPSDLSRLFAAAGLPRRSPPPYQEGCRLDDQGREGAPPRITSPQEGLVYSLRAARVGQDPVPLMAVTESDAHELFWFVDAELVGRTRPGVPLLWSPRPGSFVIRAVDDQGRAGAARVRLEVVQ
jgi:penicillin-binding protein 1C